MSINVKYISNPDELERVYRFRYSIYVLEMNRQQTYVDHESQIICDPLDKHGFTFAVYEHKTGDVIGTIRVNLLDSDYEAREHYADLYGIAGSIVRETSINTRLMIRRDHRRWDVLNEFVIAAYKLSLVKGMKFNFIDCNPPLDRISTRYGYVSVLGLDISKFRYQKYQ